MPRCILLAHTVIAPIDGVTALSDRAVFSGNSAMRTLIQSDQTGHLMDHLMHPDAALNAALARRAGKISCCARIGAGGGCLTSRFCPGRFCRIDQSVNAAKHLMSSVLPGFYRYLGTISIASGGLCLLAQICRPYRGRLPGECGKCILT